MEATKAKNMETMLSAENQQEAVEVIEFLNDLTSNEKEDFFVFMQGVRFAKGVKQKNR